MGLSDLLTSRGGKIGSMFVVMICISRRSVVDEKKERHGASRVHQREKTISSELGHILLALLMRPSDSSLLILMMIMINLLVVSSQISDSFPIPSWGGDVVGLFTFARF